MRAVKDRRVVPESPVSVAPCGDVSTKRYSSKDGTKARKSAIADWSRRPEGQIIKRKVILRIYFSKLRERLRIYSSKERKTLRIQ